MAERLKGDEVSKMEQGLLMGGGSAESYRDSTQVKLTGTPTPNTGNSRWKGKGREHFEENTTEEPANQNTTGTTHTLCEVLLLLRDELAEISAERVRLAKRHILWIVFLVFLDKFYDTIGGFVANLTASRASLAMGG